jgi:hypothetical protein
MSNRHMGANTSPFSSAAQGVDRGRRKSGGRASRTADSNVVREAETTGAKHGGHVPGRKSGGRADRKSRSPFSTAGAAARKQPKEGPFGQYSPTYGYDKRTSSERKHDRRFQDGGAPDAAPEVAVSAPQSPSIMDALRAADQSLGHGDFSGMVNNLQPVESAIQAPVANAVRGVAGSAVGPLGPNAPNYSDLAARVGRAFPRPRWQR